MKRLLVFATGQNEEVSRARQTETGKTSTAAPQNGQRAALPPKGASATCV
jgi:hypothetical protein